MAALPPPTIAPGEQTYAWNALARGYDAFYVDNAGLPAAEIRRRFVARLKQQLALTDQGADFEHAANVVIGLLEAAV